MPDDPQYAILGALTEGLLAREVEMYMRRGYVLSGGIAIGKDGRFHQAVVKRAPLPAGEIRLREPKHK